MIAIVDYGMGNIRSMAKALEYVGEDVVVSSRPEEIRQAERIVLPGVGAFGACVFNLRAAGFVDVLEEEVLVRRKPFLGVCVGMQLLASVGLEHGQHDGLGWLDATVERLNGDADGLARVPHTGWNDVKTESTHGPFAAIRSGEEFYFNHSFHVVPTQRSLVAATCLHGQPVVAGLATGNIAAVQFHPEKSQQAGLEFLAAFAVWDPEPPDGGGGPGPGPPATTRSER